MPRIAVMPPALASQIAAGEVVERPASAAKELVENAIDAGATRCDVEIEGGGVTRLSVIDDGSGMTRQDALVSLQRHATSKLFAIGELGELSTYGFRGEALPSIASVSRFTLVTRVPNAEEAACVEVSGGEPPRVRPAGAQVGTRIDVRDLFFNVVARRKFLRSSGTESGHVADVVQAAALAHPELTFTLTRDGRKTREWLRARDLEQRARTAADEELAACRGSRGPLSVQAFLGRPERARPGTRGLALFVNRRPVKDRALCYTIAQAYGSVLERGRYPRGVVYLELPGTLVDVNVHPQKSEVRFADARAVQDAVYQLLSVALSKAFQLPAPPRSQWAVRSEEPTRTWEVRERGAGVSLPSAGGARTEASTPDAEARGGGGGITDAVAPPLDANDEGGNGEGFLSAREPAPITPSVGGTWGGLKFIAQVRRTYLLCEGEEGLYVIDQHAAAERVNFDRLRKQYLSRTVPSQALLFPLILSVRAEEAELCDERAEELLALGLEIRVRGPETVSVHTVPRLLSRASPEVLVRDLLGEVQRTGSRAFSDAVDLALATMACHGSVRAGDEIASVEARALLQALDDADFAGHCPHGRPVVAFSSWTDLERKVGRR